MRIRSAFITTAFVLGASALQADTNVSGAIGTSTTWTVAGSPYIVTANVTVESTGALPTLTIQPGVTVKFNSGTQLIIGFNSPGALQAVGTSGQRIIFTANTATPTPGYWIGIRLGVNVTGTNLAYSTISYAGSAPSWGGVTIGGGSPALDNVISQNGSDAGVRVSAGSPAITNCTLSSNAWGLVLTGAGTPSVSATTISSNSAGGIYLNSPTNPSLQTLTITNNTGYAMTQDAKVTFGTVSGITATGNAMNGIEIRPSTADVSTTWKNAGIPYMATGTISVEKSGAPTPTLTIQAGTTIKFNAGAILQVGFYFPGSIQAVGTSGQRITFTANTASPTPGFWYGVRLHQYTTASSISYATFTYGGYPASNYYGAITVVNSSPTLDNVIAQNGNDAGIRVAAGSPTISNCNLSTNAWGLVLVGPGSPAVSGTTLSSNTYGGIYLSATNPSLQTLTITNNTGYAMTQDAKTGFSTVSGITATGNTMNGIEIRPTTADVSTTWKNAGIPYMASGTISVEKSGAPTPTLTIQAGTTIKFNAGAILQVGFYYPGSIQAVGTSGQRIIFTANTASPTPGFWYGVRLHPNTTASNISYATFTYAGYPSGNYYGALTVVGSSPTVDNVISQNGNDAGIRVTAGSPTITNCTLSSNAWGLVLTGAGTPSVSATTISSNTAGGIYLNSPTNPSLLNLTITNNTGYAISQDAKTTLSVGSGLSVSGNTTNAIELRSVGIDVSTTWRNAGLPYVVTGTVVVEKNGAPVPVLTIEPGVTIKFNAGQYLSVGSYPGELQAVGTAAAPITFTANTLSPVPGFWTGVKLLPNTTSASRLAFATVSYAGISNAGGIHINGSKPTIDHVSLLNNSYAGVSVWGTSPTIVNCTFSGNPSGLVNQTSAVWVNATLNWWGSISGPSGSGPGTGQSVSGGIMFDPWLKAGASSPEYVSSGVFTNRKFNPSGVLLAKWTLGSSQSASWTITISNAQSTVVRTLTGSGTALVSVWDGKNGSGVVQPAGTYSYTVQAVAGVNSATVAAGLAFIETTLQLAITSPTATQTVSNVYANGVTDVPIVGSVSMSGMTGWIVDYGVGAAPAAWATINSGTLSVTNNTLGTWATLPLLGALYTVRLSAMDATGDLIEVTITPTVGNFAMSQSVLQFSPAASQTVTYTSVIPFTLTETILLKNGAGQIVRTLLNAIPRTAGTFPDAWNGKNDSAALLPDGPYFYTAVVTAGANTMTWDVSAKFVDSYIAWKYPIVTSFNPFNNQPLAITYNFDQPGRMTLAFAPPGGFQSNCNPPNFCLKDAQYEESGSRTIYWSGVDNTGAYRGDVGQLFCFTTRTAFSQNAVVTYGTRPAVTNVRVTPAFYGPALGNQQVEFDLATYGSVSAAVTISFLNQSSVSILRTLTLPSQAPGHVSITWDGRADNGMWVAPGFYTLTVNATDPIGNQAQGRILTTVAY